mmetsp:Transcript_22641/g.49463  ORF Transcript_22641/g.49463 Transcript_22641/m.49463 type:complete len:266 (+) Transcript_22641:89-886(+)|eukprot:CAMPEP_0168744762 /NCGR_PEP_ID=MMETSP0724-20121128/14261_1 /TAXON_ID=265536 /ORGANISM="Amphiprora sp., Strain CCMP467" /LENGTH=265 /DNA_ID=CAMNT_0008792437 /DNA_START=108 /DNA_END=908 /DNA_ORIENTATION=+
MAISTSLFWVALQQPFTIFQHEFSVIWNDQQLIADFLWGGFWLATVPNILLMLVLESLSLDTVQKVLNQKDGRSLYWTGMRANFWNHYCLGVPVYTAACLLFCQPVVAPNYSNNSNIAMSIFKVVALNWFHDLIYYYVHKAFHSSPSFYVHHKFHHKFHCHVPPSSANAVSVVEYLLAYVLPFAVAALITVPTTAELFWAAVISSICNLALHTPCLEPVWRGIPFLAQTSNHFEHHKRLTCHYSAPMFNFDWMLKVIQSSPQPAP